MLETRPQRKATSIHLIPFGCAWRQGAAAPIITCGVDSNQLRATSVENMDTSTRTMHFTWWQHRCYCTLLYFIFCLFCLRHSFYDVAWPAKNTPTTLQQQWANEIAPVRVQASRQRARHRQSGMRGDVSGIVSVQLPTTALSLHRPASSSAQYFHWGCSHLSQWVMEESPINLSLGPPALKAWCEERASGGGKVFHHGFSVPVHLRAVRVRGRGWRERGGNCGVLCSLFVKMRRCRPTVNIAGLIQVLKSRQSSSGLLCVYFWATTYCQTRTKAAYFSINSWQRQKPNPTHLENLFFTYRTKQCALHAISIHSISEGVCWNHLKVKRFQTALTLNLQTETKLTIAQDWGTTAKAYRKGDC